jgi:hypothetical protein
MCEEGIDAFSRFTTLFFAFYYDIGREREIEMGS